MESSAGENQVLIPMEVERMINKYTHKCALSQGVLSMSERWQAQVFSEKASLEQRPGGGGGGRRGFGQMRLPALWNSMCKGPGVGILL